MSIDRVLCAAAADEVGKDDRQDGRHGKRTQRGQGVQQPDHAVDGRIGGQSRSINGGEKAPNAVVLCAPVWIIRLGYLITTW